MLQPCCSGCVLLPLTPNPQPALNPHRSRVDRQTPLTHTAQHPHNAQYEYYNAWLFNEAFAFTHALDARWGQPNKTAAILVGGWMGALHAWWVGSADRVPLALWYRKPQCAIDSLYPPLSSHPLSPQHPHTSPRIPTTAGRSRCHPHRHPPHEITRRHHTVTRHQHRQRAARRPPLHPLLLAG